MHLKNRLGEMEPREAKQISEKRIPNLTPKNGHAGRGFLMAGLLMLPVLAWSRRMRAVPLTPGIGRAGTSSDDRATSLPLLAIRIMSHEFEAYTA